MTPRHYLVLTAAIVSACADTGQERTEVPLFVAGTDVSDSIEAVGETVVTLKRADLAFGPLYLCAGHTAGELCDTARLEWLETIVINTLDSKRQRTGELTGLNGTVRSWMYDHGISSQLTRSQPYILEAAEELGDTSLVLEGEAQVGAITLPFTASVPIEQTEATELGVPVVRKSTSDDFYRDVSPDEAGLVVRFDPSAWVAAIDFRLFIADESCAAGGPPIACKGTLEATCDDNGNETISRECADLGQICVSGQGCVEKVTISPDTEAFRSLRNALVSGARPDFQWLDDK